MSYQQQVQEQGHGGPNILYPTLPLPQQFPSQVPFNAGSQILNNYQLEGYPGGSQVLAPSQELYPLNPSLQQLLMAQNRPPPLNGASSANYSFNMNPNMNALTPDGRNKPKFYQYQNSDMKMSPVNQQIGFMPEQQWIPRSESMSAPKPQGMDQTALGTNEGFQPLSYFVPQSQAPMTISEPLNSSVHRGMAHPDTQHQAYLSTQVPRYLNHQAAYQVEANGKILGYAPDSLQYMPNNGQGSAEFNMAGMSGFQQDFHLKPLANRKRVATLPRSKKGCWVCRIRHLKCDEQKPSCMSCLRLDLDCDYNEERPSYVVDKKEKTVKLKEISKIWKTKAHKKKSRK
ncbi:hypothetical protein BABINDRAFT_6370 [Babjeviella inositovora NRRL Y-12698]|uniref:Zn(2)-C6 fungal-type domain-containing protein n=1 Tax=Babjeviella inositovora NRRL Y-12698 TaxID=984486 RepID=A0A1E3QVM4_9ASCO|nr:uncharacterized protein BABINDRAFT_6370 [Babjeviella inositovora NRRL Y-12698]ODQ81710.1 hypothetical protein BABINDRAFT_6370 [Babjeviella inositovora NRRL Y-12698]